VDTLTLQTQRAGVDAYRAKAAQQDLVARKTEKEKTGAFTGRYALNPATGAQIPIWIADYVLMEYGTGAIMGVPGHDERDWEFATKYTLPIVRVGAAPGEGGAAKLTEPYLGDGVLMNSDPFNGIPAQDASAPIVA